ncbi:MAG TPA: hypothetical protein VGK57_11175 [Candidatus Binatia bacterium]|jgi:hypothetical protein
MKTLTRALLLAGWFFVAIEGPKETYLSPPETIVKITQARVAIQVGPFDTETECAVMRSLMLQDGGFDKATDCWYSTPTQ